MQIRLLRPTDEIPYDSLRDGDSPFWPSGLPPDPLYTWVAIRDAEIVGVLISGEMQSMLLLIRIAAVPTAPPLTSMLLLRRAFSDARRRGLLGYLTFLSDSAAAESKLMRIVQRASGSLMPVSGAWAYGKF